MYVSEPSTDGHLENLLEHAQDVSLWVAVEICSASSIKVIMIIYWNMCHGVYKVIAKLSKKSFNFGQKSDRNYKRSRYVQYSIQH